MAGQIQVNKAFFPLDQASDSPGQSSLDGTFNPFPDFSYTGSIRPVYPLSPKRVVPDHIPRPDYAEDGAWKSESIPAD